MLLYKKIISVLLIVATVLCLSSCGDSNDATVYFELLSRPENLDPQTASGDSELIIVRNLFEGLMRVDEKGELKEGACESYSVSGLTYTFKLRDKLEWSDGTAVKAKDFVFGIQRALSKATGAPFANRLFAIKNAKQVNINGLDCTNLGVYSEGNKVIIELEYEDAHFLEALATSVAMPCKEKYFNKTEGKYCQDANSIICNGSYDIYKWNKESFGIRLYKNEHYKGIYPAKNGAVFFSLDNKLTQTERLKDEASDIAFLPSHEIDSAREAGMNVKSVENKCWLLTIGDEFDGNVKTALLSAFSGEIYEKDLGTLRVASSIYPEILATSGTEGVGMPSYDIQYAKSLFDSIVKRTEENKFPAATLYYYDKEEIKLPVTSIIGHWQQNLSAFINMEKSSSLTELQKELKNRTLQFAVFPVTAYGTALEEYLYSFGLSGDAVTAQANLLSEKNIVPICFESTNIAYSENLTGVYADTGNGYIDFAYIFKND